jgi:hypothetical protein
MSLPYREQRQLRSMEADLFRSDSHLAGMLRMFGRLYNGQDMPTSEQAPSWHGRDRRGVTRIAVAFAVAALALSILFSAAVAGVSASGHRPPGSVDDRSSCQDRNSQHKFSTAEGITIKLIIRRTSAGFTDAR